MIHLLLVSGVPGVGGTETVMKNIVKYLDKTSYICDLLIIGSEKEADHDTLGFFRDNCRFVFFIPTLRDAPLKYKSNIKKVLKSHHYDIIHSHIDASNTVVLSVAKKCGIPVRISHSHNTGHLLFPYSVIEKLHRLYLGYERKRLPRFANYFVGCSEKAGKWLFGDIIVNSKRYMTLRNGIDLDQYAFSSESRNSIREKYGFGDDFIIGHVGRFSKQKNHPFLLDVFYEYTKLNTNSKLLLLGDGEDFEIVKKKLHFLGIEEKVIMMGNVTNVSFFLNSMDVFLLPSLYEGLAVSLVEAQANGLHCLVSDTVSKESDLTGYVKFMSLNSSTAEWASTIDEMRLEGSRTLNNDFCQNAIRKAGYAVSDAINELYNFYKYAIKEQTHN